MDMLRRLISLRIIIILWHQQNFDPSSFSHMTRVLVYKQISFGVLFVLECSFCHSVILSYLLLTLFVDSFKICVIVIRNVAQNCGQNRYMFI